MSGARGGRRGGRRGTAAGLAALVALCAHALGVAPAAAQQMRGSVRATGNYVELSPLEQDTVSRDQVVEDENGRLTFDGRPVTCILVSRCTYYHDGDVVSGAALTQDVSLTAWGFGVEGLSAVAFARTRQDVGGDFTVPRSGDAFDLLLGYAELARERWRARVGRMRTTAGLGFSGYDGAEVMVRPLDALRVEGYAGRSLAPGLEASREAALDPIEAFVPDQSSWLFGAALGWEAAQRTSVELRYQRDLLDDRSVLLSERASVDVRSAWLHALTVEASADYDVALSRLGKARLSLIHPLTRSVTLQASARRYLPYFELWTIWGYFSPVAYHEAEIDAAWAVSPAFHVQGGVGWRAYEDHHAPVVFEPLKDDALRGRIGAVVTRGAWTASAEYRTEGPAGAFMHGGDAEVRWRAFDRLDVGAHLSATQQIMEFRLGDERIVGAGLTARWQATPNALVAGGASMYAHQVGGRPSTGDWNQTRAWAAVEVGFGSEPALLDDVVPAAPLPEEYWPKTEVEENAEDAANAAARDAARGTAGEGAP